MNPFEDKANLVIDQGYTFSAIQQIKDAWEIFKTKPFTFVGLTFILLFATLFASLIPYIGTYISRLVISPCLTIGFAILALKIINGEQTLDFGDSFGGFQKWGNLAILAMALSLLNFAAIAPILITFSDAGLYEWIQEIQLNPEAAKTFPEIEFTANRIGALILSFILLIYLNISFLFAPFFVFFGDLPFWKAIESSRRVIERKWFNFFGLVFSFGLLFLIFAVVGSLISSLLGPIFAFFLIVGAFVFVFIGYAWINIALFCAFNQVIGTKFSNERTIESHLVDN